MADIGNQLEGAAGGLERLTEGFDNLLIRLSSTSALEARMSKEQQTVNKQLAKINRDKIKEDLNELLKKDEIIKKEDRILLYNLYKKLESEF